MPGRKAEIVREFGRRFATRDFEGMRPLLHPEAVIWPPEGWPEKGPMKGVDAAIRQFERLAEDYAAQQMEFDELIDYGDGMVGRLRWRVRARHSGIESELELWWANRMRGDQIVEIRYFWNRDDALEAGGLKE
jgi:ketosteroid isomerase-like protein